MSSEHDNGFMGFRFSPRMTRLELLAEEMGLGEMRAWHVDMEVFGVKVTMANWMIIRFYGKIIRKLFHELFIDEVANC